MQAGRNAASDECLTPRYGVTPLLRFIAKKGYKKIWCPFDKADSMFVRVFGEAGLDVTYSHIEINNGNFFSLTPPDCDLIASNPPYSCKDDVLRRLYALKKPFAMLLPQNSLQGVSRVSMWLENDLEYLGFDRRINFYTRGELDAWKKANHFATGYFCNNLLGEKMLFERLEPLQEHYYSLGMKGKQLEFTFRD